MCRLVASPPFLHARQLAWIPGQVMPAGFLQATPRDSIVAFKNDSASGFMGHKYEVRKHSCEVQPLLHCPLAHCVNDVPVWSENSVVILILLALSLTIFLATLQELRQSSGNLCSSPHHQITMHDDARHTQVLNIQHFGIAQGWSAAEY